MARGGKSFGGFGGGNMQQLMRQAQKMQEQLAKTQEALDEKVTSLVIKPEAVDPDDVEMLEDLVKAAVNEALRLGEAARESAMAAMAPGGMGGLF